jgi:hypothetical protein
MASTGGAADGATEELPLSRAAELILQECRTVLPGIQALFGFQLVAVFSQAYDEKLNHAERLLHLGAFLLVAIAVAMIMTPAAYHRQTGPRQVTSRFIEISARLLLWSMFPLALGICADFYLIARVILRSHWSAVLAAGLLGVFIFFWWLLPRSPTLQALIAKPSRDSRKTKSPE